VGILNKIARRVHKIIDISGSVDTVTAAERIRGGIAFAGPNAWILAFAAILASVGLNVNSIPVIIGAMLVSPLMGPIFGMGLSLGINDTKLLKDSLINLLVMVGISILASFIYFLITPLNFTNPTELASRTSPTIYDVIIALFGGLAGIFEICRKEKGTVISGVAIATALMPPLCTAGYGLANLKFQFFFGAMYLFLINTVFITIATYAMVKYLKFEKVKFLDPEKGLRVRRILSAVIVLVMVPSLWSAYVMIKNNNFKQNADAFVESNKAFDGGYIFDYDISTHDGQMVTVYVTGEQIDEKAKLALVEKAGEFGITADKISIKEHNTRMEQSQSSDEIVRGIYERADEEIRRKDLQIRALENQLRNAQGKDIPYLQITKEVKTHYPEIRDLYITKGAEVAADSLSMQDRIVVVATTDTPMSADKKRRLTQWMKIRLEDSTVVVINDK